MSENTFKQKDKNKAKDSASGSIFSRLDKTLGGNNAEGGLPVHYLPYVLFLVAIGIFTSETAITQIKLLVKSISFIRK